jgi:succinate dehydrogenase/fumarate reductase flavoprotein subunit
MRRETRGSHYREDYPETDNENWLAWIKIKKDENGNMVHWKHMIPDEWLPPELRKKK